MGLQFYASAPSKSKGGYNLGTLCIINKSPRKLNAKEASVLRHSPKTKLPTGNLLFASSINSAVASSPVIKSFQFAAKNKNALVEAKRVLADAGKLVTMIWGNKEECEAATYLNAFISLLPPPPPGAPGPFALNENGLLEKVLEEVGFSKMTTFDVPSVWDYPDTDTALRGLLSAGPVARAIENSGFQKVYERISKAIQPFTQHNRNVVYNNKFRVVIAEK